MPAKYKQFKTALTPLDSFVLADDVFIKNSCAHKVRSAKLRHYLTGLTLIEIMLSILILALIAIGTSGYRYYSILDTRRAEKQATAARIALLLNESWRGQDANSTYDPYQQLKDIFPGVGINPPVIIKDPPAAPTGPTDWETLGTYQISADNTNYFITMSYKNFNALSTSEYKTYSGTFPNSSWRGIYRVPINTVVAWPVTTEETNYDADNYWEYSLTTYVEKIMW